MSGGKKGEKALNLGARLKYPIKITKLYKNPGDTIRRQEPLLQYSFAYTMELPNNRETLELQTKTLNSITDWNAPEDGKLLSWQLRVGDIVRRDQACATVEEACTHEVQFQGLCALCGRDMNEVNWASEHRDTERAPINMVHDQTSLTVSRSAATRAEHELQSRLLQQRKLSLVVDLDQTIIHACIDPTIGEWQQDPANPNFAALQDVRRFQLDEGYHGLARGCWYYIKMRPGLPAFLDKISDMYELHVYTMGTRTYATSIAQIVDPDQKLFGNRVISRDENGNIVAKTLQRLFPVSTNMAVIMDDRADVWPFNRHNLIKVVPYDFFKGTGDINSSFLPKRSDLAPADATVAEASDAVAVAAAAAAAAEAAAAATSEADTASASAPTSAPATDPTGAAPSASSATSTTPTTSVTSATTEAVAADDSQAVPSPASSAAAAAVSGGRPTTSAPVNGSSSTAKVSPLGDDANASAILQQQAEEQERTIEKQIKDRPLLHMQEQLDKEDEEAAAVAAAIAPAATTVAAAATAQDAEQGGPMAVDNSSQLVHRPRHCVLYDDDRELLYLENHLAWLHREFYAAFDAARSAAAQQNGTAQSDSGAAAADDDLDTTMVPDVGVVLDRLKDEVLHGTTIVLSGLVPLGIQVDHSEIGLQAISFGARLQKQISRKVTHLVISSDRPRTQKVRQAARIPSIKIVNQQWLADCFSQWKHVDEGPYLIDVHPADRERSTPAGTQSEVTDSETVSDQESDTDGDKPSRITITFPTSNSQASSNDPSRQEGNNGDGDGDKFQDFDDDDDMSPIAELQTFDWGSADDELAMFLAEGDDDDDDDEDEDPDFREQVITDYADADADDDEDGNGGNGGRENSGMLSSASKRKLAEEVDTDSEPSSSSRGRSLFAKRQKLGIRSRSASKLRTAAGSSSRGDGGVGTGTGTAHSQLIKTLDGGDATNGHSAAAVAPPPKPLTTPASVDIDEEQLEAMLMAELDEEGESGEGHG